MLCSYMFLIGKYLIHLCIIMYLSILLTIPTIKVDIHIDEIKKNMEITTDIVIACNNYTRHATKKNQMFPFFYKCTAMLVLEGGNS